jgi:hypothetical protein
MPFNIHEASSNFRRLIGPEADLIAVDVTTDGVTTRVDQVMPQRPQTRPDMLGEAEVPSTTVTFLIWVCDLPTRPRVYDTITEVETGNKWQVQDVQLTCARGRWDVNCTAKVPAGEQAL